MRIGIQITKSTLFRGVQQEFHNIYHFSLATAVTAPSEPLVDEIVTKEKALHNTITAFKRASVWTAGGTKAENRMIFQKPLTGFGSILASTTMDKERALLIRWPAGFDVRGLPVYLRKWFHVGGNPAGVGLGTPAILSNEGGISDGERATVANMADGLRNIGTGDFWQLVSAKGRDTKAPAQCHKFLEHHQLGDQWR